MNAKPVTDAAAKTVDPLRPLHPDGLPLLPCGVVPADALVVLSRTNLRTISRVLCAIEILQQATATPLDDLLSMLRVPSETPNIHPDDRRPSVGNPETKVERVAAVDELMARIDADSALFGHIDYIDAH